MMYTDQLSHMSGTQEMYMYTVYGFLCLIGFGEGKIDVCHLLELQQQICFSCNRSQCPHSLSLSL